MKASYRVFMRHNTGSCAVCGGYSTFEEGSAVDEVAPVREAWSTRTELVVFWSPLLGTLVTLRAPGYTHGAAAGVYSLLTRDGSRTALVLMGEITVLHTQVWNHVRCISYNKSGIH